MKKIIEVKAIPNSIRPAIVKHGKKLKVKIDAPAEKGKANERLIEILSDYFKVKKSKIRILKGFKSSNKILEIDLD